MSLVATYDIQELGAPRPFAAAFLERPAAVARLLAPLRLIPDLPPADGHDRSALAAALAVANESYGHPRARDLAALLADPSSRVVVTGQQPGLLGGPLLTVHKAIAAVKWADRVGAETGRPAVPVFWMATEDHDWAEMTESVILTATGPERLTLGEDPLPLAPAGTRTLGPGLVPLLERMRAAQPSEWALRRFDELAAPYRPDARFGEAFARLLVRLLGRRCPLIVDAMLPAVKEAERPILRRLVEERAAVAAALGDATARLRAHGFEPQVSNSHPDAAPLYLQRGAERRRIQWRGDARERFALRGGDDGEADLAELYATIEENPSVVSAGVLARPLVQDAILGTSLQVLGGAELAYMAQVAPLYERLGVRAPAVALRAQALTLDAPLAARVAPWLDRLPEIVRGAAPASLPPEGPVQAARTSVEAAVDGLRAGALALDPTLERPWEKTRESMLRSLDQFAAKVAAAAARRDATTYERERRLRDLCRPLGAPQERTLTVAPAAARWGEAWVDDLFDHLPLEPHQVVLLAPNDLVGLDRNEGNEGEG